MNYAPLRFRFRVRLRLECCRFRTMVRFRVRCTGYRGDDVSEFRVLESDSCFDLIVN